LLRINSDTEKKLKELVLERIRSIDRITGAVTVIMGQMVEINSYTYTIMRVENTL
jgi:hypothetical protein